MGDPNSKASDLERRASVRTSRRISLQHDGGANASAPTLELDLDDDYSLLALGGMISDGFRPQPQPAAATPNNDYIQSDPAVPQVSPELARKSLDASSSSSPPVARLNRSSISKPPRGRDSFTLRHDGAMGHVAGAALSRVSSASTESPYSSNDTPYQGPTGPSHPYQMYSQGTRLARTASVATTSTTPTTRPESEYNGPRGPSHPYSMYPQNPVEVSNPQPAVPAIPLGFTNTSDPYQRRLGPEGEDLADIIGPDGHTEELPPYTRYPDEFYARKIRATEHPQQAAEDVDAGVGTAAATATAAAAATAAIPITTLANMPPTAIPGAGGIGLAARNPEFDARSVDDVGSPQSRHSVRSSTNESHHDINTAAATMSEKPQLNKYQRFARKKACGVVPYWAICLTVTAILIVLIIVAAVIGTLISHHKPPGHQPGGSPTNYQDSMPTVTVTFDATPIPTPSDLPALAQGTFGLPLNLNQAPNTCFNDTAQTAAWSCNIAFNQAMAMQLTITRNAPQLGKAGAYDVTMITNASSNPDPNGNDNALSYGASAPSILPAMNMELVNDTFDLARGPAWFRMVPYNKTVLVSEDLLTVDTSSSKARRSGFTPAVSNFQRKGIAQEGDKPWLCTWPDTFVEMFIYAEQNSSYASESTATITMAPSTSATATSTGTAAGPTSTDTTEVIEMAHLTAYPRAIKVKERRVNQSPRPYCVQVVVTADNTTQPITDSNGDQVIIQIEEIEQSNGMDKRDIDEDWLLPRNSGAGDMSDCGCMWFSS